MIQGARIPRKVLDRDPLLPGLAMRHRGKVRDSYNLPGHPDKMLVVVSDRASIFDFVLGDVLPLKGEYLNAFNHFWTKQFQDAGLFVDQLAAGSAIDEYLPERNRDSYLQRRATVVQILEQPQVEDVVRFHLTGSGWESYKKDGMVCGHQLPPGLTNGSLLPEPLYTPTTKAVDGHDEPLSVHGMRAAYSGRESIALQVAQLIHDVTSKHDIITADTKLELSLHNGAWYIVDERGTPDSSRFWDKIAWERAMSEGGLPPSLDKQVLRNWGSKERIDKDKSGRKRDPSNDDDLAFVAEQSIDPEVIKATLAAYAALFYRLTDMTLPDYQRKVMLIR